MIFRGPRLRHGSQEARAARGLAIDNGRRVRSVAETPFSDAKKALVQRLKRAALMKRAMRRCGIYVVSLALLLILLSPLWIALLFWWQ
jgi:hypothetical protein